VTERYDGSTRHTILHGIGELIDAGLWPLAIVIFCASIAIPLLKLAGLTALLWSVHRRSVQAPATHTRLHRHIGSIGRWSNIDVFTISVFVPLLRFGGVMTVDAGAGANAFMGVVVLTMLASESFDSRLLWDAAGAGDARHA
jgi:paraquat-inducible protein A